MKNKTIKYRSASDNSPNRREFIKRVGGGITLFFTIQPLDVLARREYPEDLNAYLTIHSNGRITCFTGKIEMGQGIITSLAQMLADELEVALNSIDMVLGDTVECMYDSGTFGSRSTKYFGPPLREAGAKAKAILLQMAAEHWNVKPERLFVQKGVIKDNQNPNNKISYAQLAGGDHLDSIENKSVQPEPYSQHTISGKATDRTDARAKVTGQAQFTGDIRLDGLLYARVLCPPAHGATLLNIDTAPAKDLPGIKIVEDGDMIAVLHDLPDQAEKALQKLRAEYNKVDAFPNNENIFEHLEKSASEGRMIVENGDILRGEDNSSLSFNSTYYNHYVAHAPIETHTVLVDVQPNNVKMWASTQVPFRARDLIAETLNIKKKHVHVMTPFVGGGFGGKKTSPQMVQAAHLSKRFGRPVQITWSRKEEFFYDTFRPAAVIKLKTGLDKNNRISYWDYKNYFAGSRSSEPIYDIQNVRVYSYRTRRGGNPVHPFGVGAWRGPGSNTNVFAMESQIDIMAKAAGMDPFSFRLKNIKDERMNRVMNTAAREWGESFKIAPSGQGIGMACTNYLNTYVVTLAKVRVIENRIQVQKILCAQDMGEIINPEGARMQIEGGLFMGLGYVLKEEIKFQGGKILTENFGSYDIARFSDLPEMKVVLVNNPKLPPQGCGEPAITTMGAVIANAVYDAIGTRLYTLPMTPNRIKNARA